MTKDVQSLELPDERYTVNPEFCGYEEPRFVPRFMGERFNLYSKSDFKSPTANMQAPSCIHRDASVAYCLIHHMELIK